MNDTQILQDVLHIMPEECPKKKTYVHTARWIIVTSSLIVKNPCFNIFTHIFSRNTREWNISKSKRCSKAGRMIWCSRGFRGKYVTMKWQSQASRFLSSTLTGFHEGMSITACDLQKGKTQKYQSERHALGRGDLERVLLWLSDGSETWLGVPGSKISGGQQ